MTTIELKQMERAIGPKLAKCLVFKPECLPEITAGEINRICVAGYGVKREIDARGGFVKSIDFITTVRKAEQIRNYFVKLFGAYCTEEAIKCAEIKNIKFCVGVMLDYNTYNLPADLGGYIMNVFFDGDFKGNDLAIFCIDWTHPGGIKYISASGHA